MRSRPLARTAGGLLSQDANATKQQVTQYLQESTAPWKLVVGHHPIYSYGEHCDYKARGDCVDMLYWGYQLQVRLCAHLGGCINAGGYWGAWMVSSPSQPHHGRVDCAAMVCCGHQLQVCSAWVNVEGMVAVCWARGESGSKGLSLCRRHWCAQAHDCGLSGPSPLQPSSPGVGR